MNREHLMRRPVRTCSVRENVQTVARVMRDANAADRLVGIISLADLALSDGAAAAETLGHVAAREVLDARGNVTS